MKIVFILQVFPAISVTFINNQITGLLDKGHDIRIIAYRRGEIDIIHPEVNKYQLLDKTIFLSPEIKNKWLRWAKQILLLPWNCIQNPRLLKCFKTLDSMKALLWPDACAIANYYKNHENIDIIHVQFADIATSLAYLKMAGIVSVPLVVSFRGPEPYVDLMKRPNAYKYIYKYADKLLSVSEDIKQLIIEYGAPEDKVLVHHSGISLNNFPFLIRESPEEGHVRLVCIARLVENKGVGYLLEAVGCLHRQSYNIHLDIFGDGPLRMVYHEQIRKSGISEIVQLHGSCDKITVIKFLQQSHILICPSIRASNNADEGIPNALKEAMATGLPVIATRTGGSPELVEDGKTGFLVPQKDAEALAEKIIYLIEHPQIWPNIARHGRSRIEMEYDSDKLNEHLEEIYKQLLEKKKKT